MDSTELTLFFLIDYTRKHYVSFNFYNWQKANQIYHPTFYPTTIAYVKACHYMQNAYMGSSTNAEYCSSILRSALFGDPKPGSTI